MALRFAPVHRPVAAVQVDGDAHADPYQLYLDNSHFYWK